MPHVRPPRPSARAALGFAAVPLALALLPAALPAQTPSAAPATAASALVGTYVATRPGADAMQTLRLRLRPDGSATLQTNYSIERTAAGTRVYPLLETGTWLERSGTVVVRLERTAQVIDGKPAGARASSERLTLVPGGCRLRLVADPANGGPAKLAFFKAGCTT